MSDEGTKGIVVIVHNVYAYITIRLWGKSAGIAAGYSFMDSLLKLLDCMYYKVMNL